MAKKAAKDAAKKKAAKQKKILMVLAVPMLAALVYAYMTLTSLNKPQVSGTPAAQTTAAGSVPKDGSVATVTPGIVAPPMGLVSSFAVLGRKDPFHDNGPHATSGGSKAPTKKGGGSATTPKLPAAPLTGAVISLNGNKLSLSIGATFGHAPGLSGVSLFRLISVSQRSAVIGVVGTEQRFTLHAKRPLTLAQDGGWTYKLILEPLGSPGPMSVQPATTQPTIADQQTP